MDFNDHFCGGFYGKEITLVEYHLETVQFGCNISLSKDSRQHFWLVINILQWIQFLSQ
jgi:hypothetical protein